MPISQPLIGYWKGFIVVFSLVGLNSAEYQGTYADYKRSYWTKSTYVDFSSSWQSIMAVIARHIYTSLCEVGSNSSQTPCNLKVERLFCTSPKDKSYTEINMVDYYATVFFFFFTRQYKYTGDQNITPGDKKHIPGSSPFDGVLVGLCRPYLLIQESQFPRKPLWKLSIFPLL